MVHTHNDDYAPCNRLRKFNIIVIIILPYPDILQTLSMFGDALCNTTVAF